MVWLNNSKEGNFNYENKMNDEKYQNKEILIVIKFFINMCCKCFVINV